VPRDEALLRRRCAELSDLAVRSPDRDARMAAASALAWVPDPVAVPFIEEALRRAPDSVWPYLIPALASIDAVEALELLYSEAVTYRHARLPASGRSSLARHLLYRKAHGRRHVGDEGLWRRIDDLFAGAS
jgi:hypothetical protein